MHAIDGILRSRPRARRVRPRPRVACSRRALGFSPGPRFLGAGRLRIGDRRLAIGSMFLIWYGPMMIGQCNDGVQGFYIQGVRPRRARPRPRVASRRIT